MSEPAGFPPYEPGRDLPVSRSPRPAAPGRRVGRADGVSTRVESHGSTSASETILAFRLLEPTASRPVEVELRGLSLAGSVRQGDWIEVSGLPGRSGRLEVASVTNLTTGAEVTAIGSSTTAGARAFKIIFLAVFCAFLVTFVAVVIWITRQSAGF